MKKVILLPLAILLVCLTGKSATPILGTPVASAERMYQYVKSKNPGSSFTREIAQEFHDQGVKYGIRGDIALCQSCIETGWFKYTGGTAVTPDDHNYCGLGVTTLGQKGCQFSSIAEGVSAQLQHLWAYATTKALPSDWTLVDPRFKYVSRGCAPNWDNLGGGKWASSTTYASSILSIYKEMSNYTVVDETPKLTVSKTSLTLSGKKGETPPSVSFDVVGKNLKSAILFNSSTGSVKLSKSGWNDYTGGKITVTLNTDMAAGTYNGYIAVQTGSGSSLIRHEVSLTVTIEEADITDTPVLPDQFTRDWVFSAATGNSSSYFNPANELTRNMVLKGDNLYIVQRGESDCAIRIVDANTGALKGQLPTTGITLNNYTFSSVAILDDGTILAVNMGYSATTKLTVYAWKTDTSAPIKLLETTDHCGRSGDLMSATGTLTDGKIYLSTNSSFRGYEGRLMIYDITDGTASTSPRTVILRNASGAAYNLGGGFAVIEVRQLSDGNILASGTGGASAIFTKDGQFVRQLNATAVDGRTLGSSCAMFSFGGRRLAAVTSYKHATLPRQGYINLVDATDMANPVLIRAFDPLGASDVDNSTRVNTVLARVDGSKIHLWTLIPKQGIAKYSSTASSAVEGIIISNDSAAFTVAQNTLSVVGADCRAIDVYNTTGTHVAHASEATLQHSLPSGVYIAVASLADGTQLTRKFFLR